MNLEFEKPHIEVQRRLRPIISTESVDGVTIGRAIVPMRPHLLDEVRQVELAAVNDALISPDLARAAYLRRTLVFSLNNNTAMHEPEMAFERPVSAYFTLDTTGRKLIIEWGKIDPTNKIAKLHTYLNNSIDYRERVQGGMKLSSGHIAKMSEGDWSVALLDNLPNLDTPLEPSSQMGKMVRSLYSAGIIPITPDGHVRTLGNYMMPGVAHAVA